MKSLDLLHTSITSTLRVDLGITLAPGKKAKASCFRGYWYCDSKIDLNRLTDFNSDIIVSLLSNDELAELKIWFEIVQSDLFNREGRIQRMV